MHYNFIGAHAVCVILGYVKSKNFFGATKVGWREHIEQKLLL